MPWNSLLTFIHWVEILNFTQVMKLMYTVATFVIFMVTEQKVVSGRKSNSSSNYSKTQHFSARGISKQECCAQEGFLQSPFSLVGVCYTHSHKFTAIQNGFPF